MLSTFHSPENQSTVDKNFFIFSRLNKESYSWRGCESMSVSLELKKKQVFRRKGEMSYSMYFKLRKRMVKNNRFRNRFRF